MGGKLDREWRGVGWEKIVRDEKGEDDEFKTEVIK